VIECPKTIRENGLFIQRGRVVYLFKKGETKRTDNYRPVTILNIIYKIWANIQTEKVRYIVKDSVGHFQLGFKQGHGCDDALSVFNNFIIRAKSKDLSIALMDLSKAFDRTIRRKIWERLEEMNVPLEFIETLRNGHKYTTMTPQFGGKLGQQIKINRGVFQGSPLSPLLFIIYTEEMNRWITEECKKKGYKAYKLVRKESASSHPCPCLNPN